MLTFFIIFYILIGAGVASQYYDTSESKDKLGGSFIAFLIWPAVIGCILVQLTDFLDRNK